jgi:type I restriction enzyme M protein
MAIRVLGANPEYIYTILLAKYDHIQSLGGGAAIPGITREDVLGLEVPLPPLATQQSIVAEIEAEQALVNANKDLIDRFEKKIQAVLARVWGEEQDRETK